MEHALTEEPSLDDSRNRRLNPNLKTSCAAAKEAKENCGIVLCLLARKGSFAPQKSCLQDEQERRVMEFLTLEFHEP